MVENKNKGKSRLSGWITANAKALVFTLTIVIVSTNFVQNIIKLYPNLKLNDSEFLSDSSIQLIVFSSAGIFIAFALLFLPEYLSGKRRSLFFESPYENRIEKSNDLGKILTADPTLLLLISNIETHINKIEKNSIINLLLGIVGTTISVSVLISAIFSKSMPKEWDQFVLEFFPRLSFIVLLQLFSFFFLRLYKTNQEDSKYFQNELTNMISKAVSIHLAMKHEDSTLSAKLIEDLSKVERNFKLAAGESLLNLERSKIEKEYDLETLNAFKDFLKMAQKEKK